MRRWDLGIQCLKDAQYIYFCGRKRIIKILLSIKNTLLKSDQKYLLNTLYIDHYLLWIQVYIIYIQTLPSNICNNYSNQLKQIISKLNKNDLNLNLCELDIKAREIYK